MNGFGRGKRSTRRETCPDATLPTKNPSCQIRARTPAAVNVTLVSLLLVHFRRDAENTIFTALNLEDAALEA
jgi:hypothetical protein